MEGIVRPRVIIIGAGFAGLWAAQALAPHDANITIIDRNNYHTFFPLLYQVAAAEVEPEHIARPVRGIFHKRHNVEFAMGRVERVDLDKRRVQADGRSFFYDYLVVAPGSASHFFGVKGAREHAFRLKSLEHGMGLRNHILRCFERAVREDDLEHKRRLLTFTVVGGGPTGVEFAGALSELIGGTLARDFPGLNLSDVTVNLLEAGDNLLLGYPDRLGQYAAQTLRKLGVAVRLGAMVTEIGPDGLALQGGEELATRTVVWTAGVRGVPEAEEWGLPTARNGQVLCEPTLQVPGRPEVYVAGDICHFPTHGQPLPMIAPVAIQQGRRAARNILARMRGRPPKPFKYLDKGSMAVIGRKAAAVRLGRRSFTGFFAWIIWLFVHLLYLIGFRNRALVLVNWAWDYLFFERGARLILPCPEPEREGDHAGPGSGG